MLISPKINRIEKPIINDVDEKCNMHSINQYIIQAWRSIAPSWTLKNFIACNPLQGFEDLSFEDAVVQGKAHFQQQELPAEMQLINRETIKWCQAFFDEGQATIKMPYRHLGLYQAWRRLVLFDDKIKNTDKLALTWIKALPESANDVVTACLEKLGVTTGKNVLFLKLMLTTLPGWASYVKYRTEWDKHNNTSLCPVSQSDYLAMRLVITCVLWPNAKDLLVWHNNANKSSASFEINEIHAAENTYRISLLESLHQQIVKKQSTSKKNPTAQFVFCIDVRSEPFRRALEAQGNYETFGFAGFFGVPVKIVNEVSNESYDSCPVLLTPEDQVKEKPHCANDEYQEIVQGNKRLTTTKRLYQSIKYSFTTPFALVEMLGPWVGIWMLLKTLIPKKIMLLKQKIINFIKPPKQTAISLIQDDAGYGISAENRYKYAENFLRLVGLTTNFAPMIFLCGHGSATVNNAYATALDCGACGGRHGGSNAKILATILNDTYVRNYLVSQNIIIPESTVFVAAEHNTTTDEMVLFDTKDSRIASKLLSEIKISLNNAQVTNSQWRSKQMRYVTKSSHKEKYINHVAKRSADWAQTQPEWGLAGNAAFIVAPRSLTKNLDLKGRAFLHSYEWQQDENGSLLTTILTAPMVVAQWINNQYLFSSLDNVAYGSGSKITHNITGKIGVMQGNASDLMTGLPLQSINVSDDKAYHKPLRLLTVVCAPRSLINKVIEGQQVLQKLFGNGWVTLACMDPDCNEVFYLERDMSWSKALFLESMV